MTDTTPNPGNPGSHRSGKFYPLTPELARELRAIEDMSASAWKLWSYLATFEPFGKDYIELPELPEILAECNIGKTSFYKAIALFHEHDLFDLQPTKMYVLNLRGKGIVRKRELDSAKANCQFGNAESQFGNAESPKNETPDSKGFPGLVDVPIRSKDLKEEQNNGTDINKKEFGTGIEGLFKRLENAGINPNKTIQQTISTLQSNLSAAAALVAVENAISALREQQAQGTVQNPGGFINAALKRNYTANGAKREAREKRKERPPSLNQISMAVDQAITRGDRVYALSKLQALWSDGWEDQVEELCILRKRDWGFSITEQGVSDGAT